MPTALTRGPGRKLRMGMKLSDWPTIPVTIVASASVRLVAIWPGLPGLQPVQWSQRAAARRLRGVLV